MYWEAGRGGTPAAYMLGWPRYSANERICSRVKLYWSINVTALLTLTINVNKKVMNKACIKV